MGIIRYLPNKEHELDMMYVFDIETLGTDQDSVLLSMGAVRFENDFTYESLMDDGFFVKLRIDQQLEMKRTISDSTLDFWHKQDKEIQAASFFPSNQDVDAEIAFDRLREWVGGKCKSSDIIWTRGGMDDMIASHLASRIGKNLPWHWRQIRDVRTAIDVMYGTGTGYCGVSITLPSVIKKHHPTVDCAYDACMLKYGVEQS